MSLLPKGSTVEPVRNFYLETMDFIKRLPMKKHTDNLQRTPHETKICDFSTEKKEHGRLEVRPNALGLHSTENNSPHYDSKEEAEGVVFEVITKPHKHEDHLHGFLRKLIRVRSGVKTKPHPMECTLRVFHQGTHDRGIVVCGGRTCQESPERVCRLGLRASLSA